MDCKLIKLPENKKYLEWLYWESIKFGVRTFATSRVGRYFLNMQTTHTYIFFCLVLLFGGCIQKSSSEYKPTYLDSTREMTKHGEYQKALARYLWFHNHILEQDTGMKGVRLSFALSYWKELGQVYPPAMAALIEDRDMKTEQIILNGISNDFFADVVAINRTLKDKNKTIELFELISDKYPVFAHETIDYVLNDLLTFKKYGLIKKNIGDLMEQYDRIESKYRESFKEIGKSDKSLKLLMEDSFVDYVLKLIQYCTVIDYKITATKIQTKALTLVDDSRIKKAFLKE